MRIKFIPLPLAYVKQIYAESDLKNIGSSFIICVSALCELAIRFLNFNFRIYMYTHVQ